MFSLPQRIALFVGGVALLAAGIFGIMNYKRVAEWFTNGESKVRGMSRSTWGKVADAADQILHTERDPQRPTPIGFNR